ncbi:MAG: class I SAM-dependent methyltransferase [Pseudomonadota bacterium]
MHEEEEQAAKRIVSLYEEKAATWSRNRGRDPILERRWLNRLLSDFQPSAIFLDLGAGNGHPIGATLLSLGHKVVGVDSSASLIGEAIVDLPNGEWHVADMREFGDDRLFDGLIAWHSFFHLTQSDQREIFPRFARFVRPGGRLLFTSGPKPGVTMGDWEGEPLFHASLSQDEYKSLLDAAGFELVEVKTSDPMTGGATVWLAQRH